MGKCFSYHENEQTLSQAMAHNSHSDDSSAITSEISVIVGDDESDLKPNFNSTAITNDDRPFTHRADWKSVNSSLRISPILHETRNALNINQRSTNFENSNPMARRECEPSMIDTSHFTSHVDMSSSGERKFESGYETSVDCDGRRLQLIEEDKENELDGAHEHPGTSTPVRESAQTDTAETTRSNHLTNPFESHLIESLCTSTLSPSLFSVSKTPKKNGEKSPAKFRWSIDQIAILNPADIEESQADIVQPPDPVFEARVQSAIDKFWSSQKFFVPSPDANIVMSGSSSRTERSPFQYPSSKRPSIYRSGNRNVARMGESPLVRPGVQRVNSPLRRTKEVQTLLTFPHDLDLVKLLGGRFQFNEEEGGAEEGVSEANLSLNSLRRKLFADYDSSFSSKGNDSDSLNATRNSASPEPLKFDEECNIANDEPSEGDYLESDISACDGDTPASSVRRRRMVSPDMSPIRFLS